MDRLSLQLVSLREVLEDVLGLTDELRGSTIEAVLAKSDLEVGLESLFGGQILHPQKPRTTTGSRRPTSASTPGLQLPPGVSLASIAEPGLLGWVIGHSHLGEVGRVVLREVPGGGCQMDAEVVGPPSDPAFDLRRAVVEEVVGTIDWMVSGEGP